MIFGVFDMGNVHSLADCRGRAAPAAGRAQQFRGARAMGDESFPRRATQAALHDGETPALSRFQRAGAKAHRTRRYCGLTIRTFAVRLTTSMLRWSGPGC